MTPVVLLTAIGLPLVVTVALETGVAVLLGAGRRTTGAVVWVNFVTNPVLNLIMLLLLGLGVGFTQTADATSRDSGLLVVASAWIWALLFTLEALVVVVEWRALAWAANRQREVCVDLLALSFTMNAVSGVLGTMLIGAIS